MFNKSQDRSNTEKVPKVQPNSQQQAGSTEGLSTEKRKIILIILPIIALVLLGILVTLIIKMPKSRPIRLERQEIPKEKLNLATQPTSPRPNLTRPVSTQKAKPRTGKQAESVPTISPKIVSQLISTGAGVSPGLQDKVPEVVDEPADNVWMPENWDEEKFLSALVGTKQTQDGQSEVAITEPSADSESPITEPSADSESPITEPTAETIPSENTNEEPVEEPINGALVDNVVEPEVVEPVDEGPLQPIDTGAVAGGFYPTELDAYIYGEIVNVRADASMDSEIMFEVHAGDLVYEIESNGSWSRVRLQDGFEGYIFSSLLSYNYVAPAEPLIDDYEPEPEYQEEEFMPYYGTLYSTFSGVNIRALPTTESNQIGSLYYGDSVEAIAYTGGWFQVVLADGSIGYVYGEYLSEEAVEFEDISGEVEHQDTGLYTPEVPYIETPSDLGGGNAIVNTAMQFLGYPYVFGAAGPGSFDCSGLVCYVYSQYGVYLSRTTYTQVNEGIAVNFGYKDYSQMVPGDLVLFATGGSIGHVGIYIGGGQFIHAANPDVGVVIDDLNNDFWASSLAHVRRILY